MGGVINFSNYGLACKVPFYQATFVVAGQTMTLAQLKAGQTASITITAFSGPVVSIVGNVVTLNSPNGTVIVAAQVLSDATQKLIWVTIRRSDGTTAVMTLYTALSTIPSVTITGVKYQ